jgi:hypothetical protein
MGKKNQTLASKRSTADTDTVPSNQESQPLEIRKFRPGEFNRRTGKGRFHYCIKVQEYVDPRFSVQCRYHPVMEPVLSAVEDWLKPVIFHEMVCLSGERFAYPQLLCKDRLNPRDWQKCEKAAFAGPLDRWVAIIDDYSDQPGEYALQSEYTDINEEFHNPDFDRQLDAALEPYVIKDVDHPLARRLRQLTGDLAETEAHLVWSDVG